MGDSVDGFLRRLWNDLFFDDNNFVQLCHPCTSVSYRVVTSLTLQTTGQITFQIRQPQMEDIRLHFKDITSSLFFLCPVAGSGVMRLISVT